MTPLTRRTFVTGTLAAAGAATLGATTAEASPRKHPHPHPRPHGPRSRATLPSGIQSGDVTPTSAVVWARSSEEGRMIVTITRGRSRRRYEVRGPLATAATDFTAQVQLRQLTQDTDYEYWIEFEDRRGRRGERGVGRFRTPAMGRRATSLVWTADTSGQGWGINPELGGMVAYQAMLATRPDLFIHSGDNIYGDNPILPEVVEPDGQIWRNVVDFGVDHVSETLADFRGRYRYNQSDANVREFYRNVPVISQWDDHEVTNNWYPGEILTDERYAEKRLDVLVPRARQAFFENMPMATGPHPSGRIYRKVERGGMLDVFVLDMRTDRGTNTPGLEPTPQPILGREQVEWLIRGLARSKATWKVIAADMPIGLIVPDGPVNIEAVANRDPGLPLGRELEIAYVLSEIKRRRVRNVVWLTGDVHYCAVHHYDPARAKFQDFDPFYEFVAGPISAGGFGPNELDATFGPELQFQALPRYVNQSPRDQKAMFFGHCDFDHRANLTVSLRNGLGEILNTTRLTPTR
ncbi:MAG: alkaline phosphatase D family protein [Propionibacteriaceae bacterium]|nr:alkaline phosphatase D family protein [Propionibacteriaceae bacterium]